nr:unnamed protein product [Callosobruchus analis]
MELASDIKYPAIPAAAFYRRKKLPNLDAAADFITSCSSNDIDVVILPPDPDMLTDEEDIDEDNLESAELPSDVPGMLEVFMGCPGDASEDDFTEWDDSDTETLASKRVKLLSAKEPKSNRSRKKDPSFVQPNWQQSSVDYTRWQPMSDGASERAHIFEKLVDDKISGLIVEQSELYAHQKNNHAFSLTTDDLKQFLGILFFTGYHRLPRERSYWSLDEDLHVEVVSRCMSRNRYLEIKKYLHINNNAEINNDRMYKLRPLMVMLNANFQQWGIFHKMLSVDEAMVKYYGHLSAKQFIRGKPCRFGFKNWSLCSSSGYCYAFDTYCGKSVNPDDDSQLPLSSKVVLSILKCVSVPIDHIIFFDNYFTGLPLLTNLRQQGFRATGTLRQNRTEKCPLISAKEMEKKKRGTYDHSFDNKNEILLVRWKDSSVCTMATNYDNVEPLRKVKRWCKTKKEKTDIQQPNVFQTYNRGMGGVDNNDQGVNKYRIAVRGKKWYWVLFTSMLNVALVNAWKLHQMVSDEKMDLLLFTRNVTRYYLRFSTKANVKSRNSSTVPWSIVQDSNGHFPQKLSKQLRCSLH